MNRKVFWLQNLDYRLSRRAAIRAAALGAATLPLARFTALAQSGPAVQSSAGLQAADFALRLPEVAPATIRTGVVARKGNQKTWPVLRGVSVAGVEIPIGTWRAPHLHTNTSELAVILQSSARAGLRTPQGEWLEVDLQAGDCVYFPLGWPHWLRNTGDAALLAHFNYGHEQPETVELEA